MDKKHKGAWAELKATTWLLDQGYEVFRNVSQHGPIDIIARHPETKEIRFIDVKTNNHAKLRDGTIKHYTNVKGASEGVEVIGVHSHTGECNFSPL